MLFLDNSLKHVMTNEFSLQMVGIYRDPKGEKIFEKTSVTTTTNNSSKMNENEGLRKRIKLLEDEVNEKNVN